MPKLDGLSLQQRAAELDDKRKSIIAAYRAGVGTTRIAWHLCTRCKLPATPGAVRYLLEQSGVELRSRSEAAAMRWKRAKYERISAQNT